MNLNSSGNEVGDVKDIFPPFRKESSSPLSPLDKISPRPQSMAGFEVIPA
jgi:hypothetical protein